MIITRIKDRQDRAAPTRPKDTAKPARNEHAAKRAERWWWRNTEWGKCSNNTEDISILTHDRVIAGGRDFIMLILHFTSLRLLHCSRGCLMIKQMDLVVLEEDVHGSWFTIMAVRIVGVVSLHSTICRIMKVPNEQKKENIHVGNLCLAFEPIQTCTMHLIP